jgi:hypothetical protein
MLNPSQDVGGSIKTFAAGYPVTGAAPIVIVAAGAGDATAVTGKSIDRMDFDSCVFVCVWAAALADTKSLKLAMEYQESADGSSWDTAVALQASSIVATSAGGTTEYGTTSFDLSLKSKKRYIRLNFTPDLTASGTDTAAVLGAIILGGKRTEPVSG